MVPEAIFLASLRWYIDSIRRQGNCPGGSDDDRDCRVVEA